MAADAVIATSAPIAGVVATVPGAPTGARPAAMAAAATASDGDVLSIAAVHRQAKIVRVGPRRRNLSGGAPLFAGIVADAAQAAHHRLGALNPRLYRLHGAGDGIADVTQGRNDAAGVIGFRAGPGYDLPSGLGTVGDARAFVRALALAV